MKFEHNRRYALAAAAIILVPLAIGCDTPPGKGEEDLMPQPVPPVLGPLATGIAGDKAANNAKTSYLVTPNGVDNTAASPVGTARANVTINKNGATTVDYTIASNDVHDMMGMSGITDTVGNMNGTARVTELPDIDGNDVKDTFLMTTLHNPPGTGRTERTAAYGGPLTPTTTIEALRTGGQKATYTGAGGILGTVAGVSVHQTGSMSVDADFAGATVNGTINLGANATPTGHDYDKVIFSGQLTTDVNEFVINSATMMNGSSPVTDTTGNGSGSFFGAKGQGTIGTFAKSSPIGTAGDHANILGYFYGSADSLK
jgi:hypothetical protein